MRRLSSPWNEIVVLERLARGGGATQWFFVRAMDEFYQVSDLLRGGSCVSFYFANQLNVEADTESARQRMFDEVVKEGELVRTSAQTNAGRQTARRRSIGRESPSAG